MKVLIDANIAEMVANEFYNLVRYNVNRKMVQGAGGKLKDAYMQATDPAMRDLKRKVYLEYVLGGDEE